MNANTKKKFVVWLSNMTDKRDDEWVVVWAKSKEEVYKTRISYDKNRFTIGNVYTALEFRKKTGMAA